VDKAIREAEFVLRGSTSGSVWKELTYPFRLSYASVFAHGSTKRKCGAALDSPFAMPTCQTKEESAESGHTEFLVAACRDSSAEMGLLVG
jgi:hypothetical protein